MKKILCILIALVPFSANAEPEKMKLKYEGYYSRMKAGEMNVQLDENADGSYKYDAVISTMGFVKYITKYSSTNAVEGKIVKDKFFPSVFKTTFQPKKNAKQNIVINYGKDGSVTEIANPPENRKKRLAVAAKDKDNLPDPITAVMLSRERIRALIDSGATLPHKFSQPVFDGRRSFIAEGSIDGYVEKKIDGKKQKLLKLSGKRVAHAGFRSKDIEAMKTNEPVFDIYLDSNYIPVLVEGRSPLGEGTILLTKKCLGAECGL